LVAELIGTGPNTIEYVKISIMNNVERISNLPENKYLVTLGVHKPLFDAMLKIVNDAYKEMRSSAEAPQTKRS
jgi:hypothetical protein